MKTPTTTRVIRPAAPPPAAAPTIVVDELLLGRGGSGTTVAERLGEGLTVAVSARLGTLLTKLDEEMLKPSDGDKLGETGEGERDCVRVPDMEAVGGGDEEIDGLASSPVNLQT